MSRIEALLKKLPDGLDAVLITSSVNRLYFTGMQSSAGTLLAFRDGAAYFIIDFRYIEKAQKQVCSCEVILQDKLYEQLDQLLKKHNAGRVAVEGEYMTLSTFVQYQEKLEAELVQDEAVDKAIRKLRMIKSPEEIKSIKAAQKITDDAFTHICGYIRAGMTERQIAGELLNYCYLHGSQRPAFDYIVVSGVNSSLPHGVPSDKPVAQGDLLTMDFGCVVDGYCSDMTRTIGIGALSDRQMEIYETVRRAQEAALFHIAPNVSCRDIDASARDLITDAGYGKCFGHGTGHGVGIEIHESPRFSAIDETLCEPGMVITVEPGIYLAEEFGVRIEDMALVTENGYENLTASTKSLIQV